MVAALGWVSWEALVFYKGYPEGYLLWSPKARFSDFIELTYVATLPNPYTDPGSFYPPASFVLARLLSFSDTISIISVYFLTLSSLALLFVHILRPVIPGPWGRVTLAFLYLVLSYPILFCVERGNFEIFLIPSIGWAIFFYIRQKDFAFAGCLLPAICLKAYPAFFLILLLRRGGIGIAVLFGLWAILITEISCLWLHLPLLEIWKSYGQNLEFFRDIYVLSNATLENSASPWNSYKIVLLALEKMGVIPLINFGFDGPFIQASYDVYRVILATFALLCAGYAWLYESRKARGAIMLLLLLSISAPSGGDYRLSYASLALAFFMVLPDRRRGDWTALVLIALAVIPKKEVLLTFAGTTETNFCDVPLQALLNPILILVAMGVLLYQSRRQFDWRVAKKRLYRSFLLAKIR